MPAPAIVRLVGSLRCLTALDMSGCIACGDAEFGALGALPALASLSVAMWHRLSGVGVRAFAAAAARSRVCPAVAPIMQGSRSASQGLAPRLAFGQPQLSCAQLLALNLADCTRLDDDAVNALGDELPGLLDLNLFGCLRVSDKGLLGLGSSDSRLQRLNTAGVYKVRTVRAAAIYSIGWGRACCNDPLRAQKVSDAGLRFLLSQSPSLQLYAKYEGAGLRRLCCCAAAGHSRRRVCAPFVAQPE